MKQQQWLDDNRALIDRHHVALLAQHPHAKILRPGFHITITGESIFLPYFIIADKPSNDITYQPLQGQIQC